MGWDVIVPWVGLTLMLLIGAMLWVTLIRGVERSLLLRPSPRTGWRSLVGSLGGVLGIAGIFISITSFTVLGLPDPIVSAAHPELTPLLVGSGVVAASGSLVCLFAWYRLLVRAYREETEGAPPDDTHHL